MGGLAVLAALGAGGQTTGAKGALLTLLSQPFGFALLGMVAFGLLCLAVWRMAQSILNSDRLGNDRKGLVRRIGYGVSGATHAGLASPLEVFAAREGHALDLAHAHGKHFPGCVEGDFEAQTLVDGALTGSLAPRD